MSKVKDTQEALNTELEDEVIDLDDVGGSDDSSGGSGYGGGWWNRYKNIVIGGAAAIILGVGGYLWYQNAQEEKEKEAQDQMFTAFNYYMKDSLDKAVNGSAQNPGLKKLVDEYGSTKAGNLSKYMLGTVYLSKGKLNEGIEQLEDFDKGDNLVSAQAYAALAYAYEEKNDFKKAADFYMKAARTLPNNQTSPEYMAQAARCYEEAKENSKALNIYKEVKAKYPLSDPGRQADKYIARLSNE